MLLTVRAGLSALRVGARSDGDHLDPGAEQAREIGVGPGLGGRACPRRAPRGRRGEGSAAPRRPRRRERGGRPPGGRAPRAASTGGRPALPRRRPTCGPRAACRQPPRRSRGCGDRSLRSCLPIEVVSPGFPCAGELVCGEQPAGVVVALQVRDLHGLRSSCLRRRAGAARCGGRDRRRSDPTGSASVAQRAGLRPAEPRPNPRPSVPTGEPVSATPALSAITRRAIGSPRGHVVAPGAGCQPRNPL